MAVDPTTPAAVPPAAESVTPESATPETAPAAVETPTTPDPQTPNAGPPEQYALTNPDESIVSAERLAAFEQEARDLGLTNAQAQAHLDRRVMAVMAEADRLLAETTADPTWGGANLPQTQKFAEAALNRFAPAGTPEGDGLRVMLRNSGYGDALPIVALFARIGKAMAEDRPLAGGQGIASDAPVRLADAMYANSTSKPASTH
jgi:hypothetical protein